MIEVSQPFLTEDEFYYKIYGSLLKTGVIDASLPPESITVFLKQNPSCLRFVSTSVYNEFLRRNIDFGTLSITDGFPVESLLGLNFIGDFPFIGMVVQSEKHFPIFSVLFWDGKNLSVVFPERSNYWREELEYPFATEEAWAPYHEDDPFSEESLLIGIRDQILLPRSKKQSFSKNHGSKIVELRRVYDILWKKFSFERPEGCPSLSRGEYPEDLLDLADLVVKDLEWLTSELRKYQELPKALPLKKKKK